MTGDELLRCRDCGAPMADDQRYCLNCGTRRAERRAPVPVLSAPAVAPLAAPATAPGLLERVGGGWGVAALVLLALGVGVVIGELGDGDPAPVAARAPIVSIGAGALAPTGVTAVAAPVAAAPAPVAATGPTGSTEEDAASTAEKGKPAAATQQELAAKEKLAPDEFVKQSKKLPKTTGTGGAAPEKDNAAPGAGSEAESIG